MADKLTVPKPIADVYLRKLNEMRTLMQERYGDSDALPDAELGGVTVAECEQMVEGAMRTARRLLAVCRDIPDYAILPETAEVAGCALFLAMSLRGIYHRICGTDPTNDLPFNIVADAGGGFR